jgi:hypothetical protein
MVVRETGAQIIGKVSNWSYSYSNYLKPKILEQVEGKVLGKLQEPQLSYTL